MLELLDNPQKYRDELAAREEYKLRPTGIDFGGYKNLPENLKDWIKGVAHDISVGKLKETGWVRGKDKWDVTVQKEYELEMDTLLNNPDFIKQAIANSAGAGVDKNNPMAWASSLGSKGKIGRQEGSIKFWQSNPEFNKFKDNLPKIFQKDAKRLYREWKREQIAPKPEVVVKEHELETLKGIPGLERSEER